MWVSCVCVCKLCVGKEVGGGGGGQEYKTKNKNPTQRCWEKPVFAFHRKCMARKWDHLGNSRVGSKHLETSFEDMAAAF